MAHNIKPETIDGMSWMAPMRSGRYEGTQLAKIPSDYLIWCLENAPKMLDSQQIDYIKINCIK